LGIAGLTTLSIGATEGRNEGASTVAAVVVRCAGLLYREEAQRICELRAEGWRCRKTARGESMRAATRLAGTDMAACLLGRRLMMSREE